MRTPERFAAMFLVLATAAGLMACSGTPPDAPAAGAAGAPKLLDQLGEQHFRITTSVPLAQRYFDQGMVMTYGFNHEAAVRAFQEAERLDPGCAMCAWGIGLALGPNINAPMGPEAAAQAYAATQRAHGLVDGATALERALIEALTARYASPPPDDRAALDLAYANAMREVHRAHPGDLDVATLFAESLMDLMPWNYWTSDGKPREHTEEALALLDAVLEQSPGHVGANHYLIHVTEEFFPERGEAAADRLAAQSLQAGHLVHMPSHIYWRVGRYGDALEINQRASAEDEQFFGWCRPGAFYRAAYYPHNVHFLWAAASTEGRAELAVTTARKLESVTKDDVGEFDFLEEFMAIPMLTWARFGRWDAALGAPRPSPDRPYLTGIWHYTRGLARLRTGDPVEARAELEQLRTAAAAPASETLILAGGTASASALLAIGVAHLEGEIDAAEGRNDEAVAALGRAVAAQDALVYMEPPPWYYPTRQALGAVLLDAGRPAEAEAVYRADLDQYPANGWSLYGLARSLEAQGRGADADWAKKGHQNAFAQADVTLEASRF